MKLTPSTQIVHLGGIWTETSSALHFDAANRANLHLLPVVEVRPRRHQDRDIPLFEVGQPHLVDQECVGAFKSEGIDLNGVESIGVGLEFLRRNLEGLEREVDVVEDDSW